MDKFHMHEAQYKRVHTIRFYLHKVEKHRQTLEREVIMIPFGGLVGCRRVIWDAINTSYFNLESSCMSVCVCVCVYTYISIYVHIYIYIHIKLYI
jgi:hypothetical protein